MFFLRRIAVPVFLIRDETYLDDYRIILIFKGFEHIRDPLDRQSAHSLSL